MNADDYVRTQNGVLIPRSEIVEFKENRPARPVMNEISYIHSGRDVTRGWVRRDGMLRTQDKVLLYRGFGDDDIYSDTRSDQQVETGLKQLRDGILSTPTEVEPGGKRKIDQSAAKFINETLKHINFEHVMELVFYVVFYGYSVSELMWKRSGNRIHLDEIKVRDRRRFVFDGEKRLRLRTKQNYWDGELLPDNKFWAFSVGADHGDQPYGLGMAHWLYWLVLFKKQNIRFWLIGSEKWGQPTIAGFYPLTNEFDIAEQDKFLYTLGQLHVDATAIFPEGTDVKVIEGKNTQMSYAEFCDYMDRAIMKLITGQLMTSEAVGGKFRAETQSEIKDRTAQAYGDSICASFVDQVVKPLVLWNFPGAAIPTVSKRPKNEENLVERSQIEERLATLGYRPTLDDVMSRYGGQWEEMPVAAAPMPSAPDTEMPEQFAESGAGIAEFANIPSDQRKLENAITAITEDQANRLGKQMLRPIERVIRDGGPHDVLDALTSIEDDANLNGQTELLSRIFMISDAVGRLQP